MKKLPRKNCGLCGLKTCEDLAQSIAKDPDAIKRCVQLSCLPSEKVSEQFSEVTWKDSLDREYDFILDKLPEDIAPRETILPFNPTKIKSLNIKKGDILYGRPMTAGCPITHVGIVVEEPDYFNGTITWCIVGPLHARQNKSTNIGYYTPIAFQGIVKFTRKELTIGMRYYFLPRYCMSQWRHSGIINQITKTSDGTRIRIEGISIA